MKIVFEIDEQIHGFTPSGLDLESCTRQTNGLYRMGEWIDVELSGVPYIIATFSRTGSATLKETQKKILRKSRYLVRVAEGLTDSVLKYNKLDYELLLTYCRLLAQLRLYSNNANAFVEKMLDEGIATKGIGGLYNKAIASFPRNDADRQAIKHKMKYFEPVQILEGIIT